MPASVTWSVTSAMTSAYLAQYVHNDTSYPVDTTDFPHLLAQSAATVCRHVIAAGYVLAAFANDTASVAYIACQGWTTRLCAAAVLRSSVGAAPDLAKQLEDAVMTELTAMVKNPQLLGAESDASPTGQTWTTVEGLGVDTSNSALERRTSWRSFGGVGNDTVNKKVHW